MRHDISRLLAALAVVLATFGGSAAWSTPRASRTDVEAIRTEARQALAEQRFASALSLYQTLLRISPADAQALREGGRAAQAMREFGIAIKLLQGADALATTPDPELHYLLGEAFWTLGRDIDARTMHALARREIGSAPTERQARLWLAKIDERLGDRAAADALYDALLAEVPADVEAALAQAAMHANVRAWPSAERAIRRLLAVRPSDRRALEMLAWIQEARGQLASELAVRQVLARDSDAAAQVRDYGRALERSGDWEAALATYRRAEGLAGGTNDALLQRALRRMDHRMSIEIAAGAIARTDPGASTVGGLTGIALPFGRAHHLALGAWHDFVSDGGREGTAGEVFAAVALQRPGAQAIAGAKLGIIDFSGDSTGTMRRAWAGPAAFARLRGSPLGRHVELGVEGEVNGVWHETPVAELEGGRVDAATGHLWGVGFGPLVIDLGTQLRRLRLMPEGGGDPIASQRLVWGGFDWALWRDFSRQAAGEILDEELLNPSYLASSVVASYRHYELFGSTNLAFSERRSLADRASVDEASAVARRAMLDGRIAFELHTGIGYDWVNDRWVGRGGLSLWLATGASSRLSLTLDLAAETARGIEGERRSGGMTYHVDL